MLISIHSSTTNSGSVEEVVAEVARVREAGLAGYWAPMLDGLDTLTTLAVAAAAVPDVRLGSAVVPIPLRSPYGLAQQALTVQQVSGGRLTLGLGTSHGPLARDLFATEWHDPIGTMRSFLEELQSLLAEGRDERLRPKAPAPEVILGAVNPRMIALAANKAHGVVTWAAGLRTVEHVIRPALAIRSADHPFRVVVSLPVCVTDEIAPARKAIHRKLGSNDRLPSYRRVLERERAAGVAELALVGNERTVAEGLDRFAEAGVSEFAAHVVATESDQTRTWQFLSEQSCVHSTPA